jgi:hypothetical protein
MPPKLGVVAHFLVFQNTQRPRPGGQKASNVSHFALRVFHESGEVRLRKGFICRTREFLPLVAYDKLYWPVGYVFLMQCVAKSHAVQQDLFVDQSDLCNPRLGKVQAARRLYEPRPWFFCPNSNRYRTSHLEVLPRLRGTCV